MLKHFTPRALRACLLLALPFSLSVARAQAPAWTVAAAATPAPGTNTHTLATAADGAGNVFVAGYFTGTAAFGSTTLTGAGGTDGFVAKWDGSSQSWAWAQHVGGSLADQITGVAVSGSRVYVVGSYTGNVNVGSLPLSGSSSADAFVAKLIDGGTSASFLWVEDMNGIGDDQFTAVAVSGNSVYVAGYAIGNANFDNNSLMNAGSADVFVGKLTDVNISVRWEWGKLAGGSNNDRATALALRGTSVYVAGYFAGVAGFGPVNLTSAGTTDVFITRLNDSGTAATFGWAVRGGGQGVDQATALAVSGTNNIYVTGFFPVTATFGSTALTSNGTNGNDDGFIAKLTDNGSAGTFVWAQAIGGPFFDHANAVAAYGSSVYVAGYYNGPAVFGATTLTGFQEVFVAKMTDTGNAATYVWAAKGGAANGSDYGMALALAPPRVVLAGYFSGGPAAFDALTLPNSTPATNVAFFASLLDPALTAARPTAEAAALALAPNPTTGETLLTLPSAATARPVQVLDALGRQVRTAMLPAHAATVLLDMAALPAGVYVVRCGMAAARLAVQ